VEAGHCRKCVVIISRIPTGVPGWPELSEGINEAILRQEAGWCQGECRECDEGKNEAQLYDITVVAVLRLVLGVEDYGRRKDYREEQENVTPSEEH
jgi:hypothetical protein